MPIPKTKILNGAERWLLISALTLKAERDAKAAQEIATFDLISAPAAGTRLRGALTRQALLARELAAELEQADTVTIVPPKDARRSWPIRGEVDDAKRIRQVATGEFDEPDDGEISQ